MPRRRQCDPRADRFRRGDAYGELERLAAAKERFGVVVCDPPAFVKSRKDLATGLRASQARPPGAAVVDPGGFLFIASCSHNVDRAAFALEVARGLQAAGRSGRILREAGAAADHPLHPHLPESAYLSRSSFSCRPEPHAFLFGARLCTVAAAAFALYPNPLR